MKQDIDALYIEFVQKNSLWIDAVPKTFADFEQSDVLLLAPMKRDIDSNERHRLHLRAIQIAFDLDYKLLFHLCQRDIASCPPFNTHDQRLYNYFQILGTQVELRDAISDVLGYLLYNRNCYDDPYDRTEIEKTLRREHFQKINDRYGSVESYLERVREMLFINNLGERDNFHDLSPDVWNKVMQRIIK